MRLAAIALATALLLPAVTPAAEPRGAREDAAVALSRFVLSEEAWAKMNAGTTAQLQQYIEATLRQSGAEVPAGFSARFSAEFAKMISYQETIDLQAGLLVKHYTAAEIQGLLAFYKTPLGQKVIRTMPEVSQDVNGQILALVQQRLPALLERMKADLTSGVPAAGPK
jgi:hypothetical protein